MKNEKLLVLLAIGIAFLLVNIACACAQDENESLPSNETNYTNISNITYENLTANQTFVIPEENITYNKTEQENLTNQTILADVTNKKDSSFLNMWLSAVAESSSYFLNMFTLGLHSSLPQGTSTQARVLLTPFQSTTRNAQGSSYTANVGAFAGTVPSPETPEILSYSVYPASASSGSTIRFYISASHVQAVWLKITHPDSSQETINLVNNDYTSYVANSIGRYYVTFYANDSSGDIVSASDHFDITEVLAPSFPSGTGNSAAEKNCTYAWGCSSWSICLNNTQTRICTNKGTCNGTTGKPAEGRECSASLFDVGVKLENTELTENGLKFNVTLTEKIGTEDIAVQVTYTILDKNRKSIFNQTEIKSVPKSISYLKTLDKINLPAGDYTLRVDILYNVGQKAYAEQPFHVNGEAGTAKIDIWKGLAQFPLNKYVIISIGLLLLLFLLRKAPHKVSAMLAKAKASIKGRKAKGQKNRVSTVIGKEIYSMAGEHIGKVTDIIIEKGKIYGLEAKLSDKVSKKRKIVVINYKNIRSIGDDAVIVGEEISVYLKSHM